MKETERLFNGYIAMFITQWIINCSHQVQSSHWPLIQSSVSEDDIMHVTTIGSSALLQFTWQRGQLW